LRKLGTTPQTEAAQSIFICSSYFNPTSWDSPDYKEYPINLLQLYSLNSWDSPFQIYIKGVVYRNMTNLPVLVVEFAGFISGSTMAPNKGKFKGYALVNLPV